jgi:hypothetical protein
VNWQQVRSSEAAEIGGKARQGKRDVCAGVETCTCLSISCTSGSEGSTPLHDSPEGSSPKLHRCVSERDRAQSRNSRSTQQTSAISRKQLMVQVRQLACCKCVWLMTLPLADPMDATSYLGTETQAVCLVNSYQSSTCHSTSPCHGLGEGAPAGAAAAENSHNRSGA